MIKKISYRKKTWNSSTIEKMIVDQIVSVQM